jgi:hypothetical protein
LRFKIEVQRSSLACPFSERDVAVSPFSAGVKYQVLSNTFEGDIGIARSSVMPSGWIDLLFMDRLKFLGSTGWELVLTPTSDIAPLFHAWWKS